MKKEQFIKRLRVSLRSLNRDEREKYLSYYEEMIADLTENGISEEDAVARQGEIGKIAEEILSENPIKKKRRADWIGAVLIVLTLLFGSISGYLMYQEYQVKAAFEKLQMETANETISIIGGADGPTSVFLAGKITFPVRPDILFMITILLIVITVLYFVRKTKKNKKQ